MIKRLKPLKQSWKKPITVLFVPYGPADPVKLKISFPFLAFSVVLTAVVLVWAGFIAGKGADYYVTKADNNILRAKMAYMTHEVRQNREFLEETKRTDKQIRRMLSMSGFESDIQRNNGALGGADEKEGVSFRKGLERGLLGAEAKSFKEDMDYINSESETRLSSYQSVLWYIANRRNILNATPSIWPTKGKLSSYFGQRLSPFNGTDEEMHYGVDISNNPDTAIYATADGVVRHTGWGKGYGQTVLIDHGFGYSTLYGHTTEIKVKSGQSVKRGQMIARMGTTGKSTGTHLHYEVWEYGKPVNPMKFLMVGSGENAEKS